MTSRTAKANWISEHLPEEYRVRLAIAVYVLIAIVAIVVSGWLLLGAITVAAVSSALYARYTEPPSARDEYVVDDGWRQQLYPVAGAFFVLACFALGGWPLVITVGLLTLAAVVFRRRYRGTGQTTGTRRVAGSAESSERRAAGDEKADSFLRELETARDEALAAIDERAIARERSLVARKMASNGRDSGRVKDAEARMYECEQQVQMLSGRLAEIEGSLDAAAAMGETVQTGDESVPSSHDDRRSAIRLVDLEAEATEDASSVRADVATARDQRREPDEPKRLSGIAELERSLEERDLDLAEREAEVKAMQEELEERTERQETHIELRLRELEAREAQLSEKEHELERYVAQAQNAIRRREAETRHEA